MQHQIDWSHSTLGRGTMNNQLFPDCNCNDVADADDIAAGTSPDLNRNGVPDECECMWDCGDGNGEVDVVDFFALIAEWSMVGTPCDFDGGGVNVVDFFDLIGHWGPCS